MNDDVSRMRLRRGLVAIRERLDDIEFYTKMDRDRRRRILALRLYRDMIQRGLSLSSANGDLLMQVRPDFGRSVYMSFTELDQLAEVEQELLELLQG